MMQQTIRQKKFSQYIHNDHLVELPYDQELNLKNQALEAFAREQHWPASCRPVIPSPRPRQYRTLSKRTVVRHGERILWQRAGSREEVDRRLEAEGHSVLYDFILSFLAKPGYRELTRHLNYVILRGDYETFCVILNVAQMNGVVVRKCKLLAEHLQHAALGVSAVFIYFDPSRSEYYLESERPPAAVSYKKLFGSQLLHLDIRGRRLVYEATAFSQINQSILPAFIDAVEDMLAPQPEQRLIDLYCGYGFFSHLLAERYAEVWGVDVNSEAIKSARLNQKRLHPDRRMHFQALAIDGRVARRGLPKMDGRQEAMVLDPPYQGADAAVIPALAQRCPARVLHIFCNIDRVRTELALWQNQGYRIRTLQPLDLFPATAHIEILALMER
ncbi:MAG TPA: methyltransferase domain-containing protein [bacterium]|nr:methyltransferase domain-containing protein [bacterium]